MSSPKDKSGAKASSSHVVKRSKQPVRPQPENIVDHSDMRSTLSKKLSELNTLHETMFEEHNRLIQENMKLTQDLIKLRLEKTQAITAKDEEIEDLRSEASKYCEKLERDIIEVESLVQKNKELEDANKDMHEKNRELHRQLSELQERLVTKDKVIKSKTTLVQSKQRDISILKEKTEQLLYIYEKSMKDNLRNISDMCTEICSPSSSSSLSTIQDSQGEAETTV